LIKSYGSGIGFSGTGIGEILASLLLFYALFQLYYDSSVKRLRTSRARSEAWSLAHFPYHVSLILLFEGMKNLLVYLNLSSAVNFVADGILNFFQAADDNDSAKLQSISDSLNGTLLKIGISWDQQLDDLNSANLTTDSQSTSFIYQFIGKIVFSLFDTYGIEPEPETSLKINSFLNGTDAVNATSENFADILTDMVNPQVTSAIYAFNVAGLTFIMLAIILMLRRWPKDRFETISVASRFAIGFILNMFSLLDVGSLNYGKTQIDDPPAPGAARLWGVLDSGWLLPIITIFALIQVAIDASVLFFANRAYGRVTDRPLVKPTLGEDESGTSPNGDDGVSSGY